MQQIPNQSSLIQINQQYSYWNNESIGKGFKSHVFKGVNSLTGELVAVKVFDLVQFTHEVELELLKQEVKALSLLDSPNIVKMFHHQTIQQYAFIVMEYCDQGDLDQMIKNYGHIEERQAVNIFKSILNGFKEQINKGIIHRDIKPSNILIKEKVLKLADYGFCKLLNGPKEKVYYNVGTTLYMSPQTLIENKYSEKSDIWSLGVMFYQILCGQVPWQANSEKEFIQTITTTPIQFPSDIHISALMKSFILKCLAVDEEKRYNVNQIMEHELFNPIAQRRTRMESSNSFYIQRGKNVSLERFKPVIINNHMIQSPRNWKQNILQMNDQKIEGLLCLLKFILRIARLVDHFEHLQSFGLQEKLLFFIIKHAVYKSSQLKIMIDRKINTINLQEFQSYLKYGNLYKYQVDVYNYYDKFRLSFIKLWFRISENPLIHNRLLMDKKFALVFDQTELELELFYITMLPVLKMAIKELQLYLHQRISNQIIQTYEEAGILLLDYFVYYLGICQAITNNFENNITEILKFPLKELVESKPININYLTFHNVCKKISNMAI